MNMQNSIQEVDKNKELIKITNLTKKYKSKAALSNINLTLESGHIVGLLGLNGSGKTTLIKILTGALNDYEGAVTINGKSVGPESKALVSYLPDSSYCSSPYVHSKLVPIYG